MDQKSRFHEEAKRLFNDNNEKPYSDEQIVEIVELLNVFADIIYNNITKTE